MIYNTSTAKLWFDGDGKGAGGQTLIASFNPLGAAAPELTGNDIIFI